ncbi:MAG: hypothetical protein IIY70_05925 [Oscillospiraceae bacterium]|nr:hypothetical protein [Oscillospiraceae bacterium]
MEDLQSTLQSILSDPEQMARISAMAESLGLKPPEDGGPPRSQTPENLSPGNPSPGQEAGAASPKLGLDLGRVLTQLSAMSGSEDRVLSALRPALSEAGQGRIDRALRAAKLSRLASQFLRSRREGNV